MGNVFTAEQAAEKQGNVVVTGGNVFTAEQAAEKIIKHENGQQP